MVDAAQQHTIHNCGTGLSAPFVLQCRHACPPACLAVVSALQTFDKLELTEQTQKAIKELGFASMTEVQARTIPQLLVGRDVLGAAKTGEWP